MSGTDLRSLLFFLSFIGVVIGAWVLGGWAAGVIAGGIYFFVVRGFRR